MSHSPPLPGTGYILVPRFHAALGVPVFPQPGLDCPPWDSTTPSPLTALPLSPAEARACMADLRAMEPEEIARALQLAVTEHLRAPLDRTEQAALTGFLHCHAQSAASPETSRLRQTQSQLLMVWVQEERLLEILELIQRYTASEARLARLLSDPAGRAESSESFDPLDPSEAEELAALLNASEASAEPDPLTPSEQADVEAVRGLLPSWRVVLARLLPFLPPEALLLINDPDMADAVRAAGTLSAEEAAPEGVAGRMFHVDAARLVSGGNGVLRCFVPDNELQREPE